MSIEIAMTCLALNVYKEARGETLVGQQAVALVTLNRAKAKGLDLCDTVFAPRQFSWTSTDTRNGVLLPGKKPDRGKKEWQVAYRAAVMALELQDFTHGATHFHAETVSPSWRNHMQFRGRFGNHYFYKEKWTDGLAGATQKGER